MEAACPRRGELDHLGERPRPALLREAEERDQDLCRGERVRKRTVAWIGRRAEEVRELREREALASPMQEPPGEPDGVDHGRGDAPAGEPLDGVVEEAHVEAGVVRGERCVAREREEAANGELLTRRAAQLGVAQAGQPGDRLRQRDSGVDQRLERLGDLERLHAHRADLAHAIARGREPGRLEVEDDELGVLDQRVRLRAVREAHASAEPRQARVTVDDVGEQGVGEARRRALEREQHACRLLRRDRAPARVDQLDEPVGGIEGELHRALP